MATDTRVPTSTGFFTQWTSSSGGDVYQDVDDAVGAPDDGTTYGYMQDSNGAHFFGFSAFSVPAGATINSVTVRWRAQRTAAGGLNVRSFLRVNGSNYFGSSQSVATTWGNFSAVYSTNPDTGIAWTVNDVNGTGSNPLQEFGAQSLNMAAGEEFQCTQIYIEVDYTPAAAGGNPWYYYQQQLFCL